MSKQPAGPKCPVLKDETINELSRDILSGQVLPSWVVPQNLWINVYMPLVFLGPDTMPEDAFAVLGNMKDAGPMGINGYPIFGACMFINREDAIKIDDLVKRMNSALKATMPKPDKDTTQETLKI